MTINKKAAILSAICIAALSSCGASGSVNTANTANAESSVRQNAPETELPETELPETELPETELPDSEQLSQTESKEQQAVREIVFSEEDEPTPFTDIDITAKQIDAPMLFGEKYGNWVSRGVWVYFGFSASTHMTIDYSDKFYDEENGNLYYPCVSMRYGSDESTAPISYASGKKFLCEKLHITDKCFDILCETAPSFYCEKDGKLYFAEGFGGGAGWDHSIIVDYEAGEDTITYNCMRLGWEQGGFEDTPFTITFKYTDGKWLLDDCTYVEGFCNYFCYTEPVEDYIEYFDIRN